MVDQGIRLLMKPMGKSQPLYLDLLPRYLTLLVLHCYSLLPVIYTRGSQRSLKFSSEVAGSPGRKRRSFGPITLVCGDYQGNN